MRHARRLELPRANFRSHAVCGHETQLGLPNVKNETALERLSVAAGRHVIFRAGAFDQFRFSSKPAVEIKRRGDLAVSHQFIRSPCDAELKLR